MSTLMTPRSLPDTSSRYWTHSDSLRTRPCQSNPLWRCIDLTFKTHP
jgi:carbonic anhydrase